MKYPFIFCLLIMCVSKYSNAQDTIFYNEYDKIINDRSEAFYYELKSNKSIDSSNYSTIFYYLQPKKKIERSYNYKILLKELTFYENGQLHTALYFDKNGYKKILTYWKKGQPKRIDLFENGKLIDGKCFDPMGNIIAHNDFEIMPKFPGGEEALNKYLTEHFVYPSEAIEKGIEGKVDVLFVINEQGKVVNVQSLNIINKLLNDEAERLIKLMPTWSPGIQDGMPVSVSFSLPISFYLE